MKIKESQIRSIIKEALEEVYGRGLETKFQVSNPVGYKYCNKREYDMISQRGFDPLILSKDPGVLGKGFYFLLPQGTIKPRQTDPSRPYCIKVSVKGTFEARRWGTNSFFFVPERQAKSIHILKDEPQKPQQPQQQQPLSENDIEEIISECIEKHFMKK